MRKQLFAIGAIVALAGAIAAVTYFAGGNLDIAALGGVVLANAVAPALPTDKPVTEADWKATLAAFKAATDEVKTFAESAEKAMKDQGALSAELKASSDKALANYAAVLAQVGDIEQKLAAQNIVVTNDNRPKTAGAIVSEHESVVGANRVVSSNWKGRHRISVPRSAIEADLLRGDILTTPSTSGGVLVEEMRIPGIVMTPNRRLTIRNLVSPGRTTSNAFLYVRETGFTNNARPVTEGQLKPQSDITFESVTGQVATIAHWFKASRQILDDAPGLRSYIDARGRFGLAFAEEAQLLRGDGTGQNLEGLVTAATAFAPAFSVAAQSGIDDIRLAMLQVFLAEYPPDGVVMNPIDWARVELTKTSDGAYLMANPAGMLVPRLWGLPVVATQAMNEGEFLVGAFQLAAQIFDREDANVEMSTEDGDNFVRNMVTILIEERLALAIYRPEALVTGEFSYVT